MNRLTLASSTCAERSAASIVSCDSAMESEELSECTQDDANACSGLSSCGAWVMMDWFLSYGVAFSDCAGEDFGVDECAGALHCDVIEDFGFVEFEGAVDVSDFHFEEGADEFCPAVAVEFSQDVVLSVQSIAAYDVVLAGQVQQRG